MKIPQTKSDEEKKQLKREAYKRWAAKDPEHVKALRRKWANAHPEYRREQQNKSSYRKWINEYRKKKYKEDPNVRMETNLRSIIWQTLTSHKNRKYKKVANLLGADINFVKDYLEDKFKPGMTWENYGEWHIDHIKPTSSFDLLNEKQQKLCFHYTNIQPLWAAENISKGNRLS